VNSLNNAGLVVFTQKRINRRQGVIIHDVHYIFNKKNFVQLLGFDDILMDPSEQLRQQFLILRPSLLHAF